MATQNFFVLGSCSKGWNTENADQLPTKKPGVWKSLWADTENFTGTGVGPDLSPREEGNKGLVAGRRSSHWGARTILWR
jgi:hypothetical protein